MTLHDEFLRAEKELTQNKIIDHHYLRKRRDLNYNETYLSKNCVQIPQQPVPPKKRSRKQEKTKPIKNAKSGRKKKLKEITKNPEIYVIKRDPRLIKNHGLRKSVRLIAQKSTNQTRTIGPGISLNFSSDKPQITFKKSKGKTIVNIGKRNNKVQIIVSNIKKDHKTTQTEINDQKFEDNSLKKETQPIEEENNIQDATTESKTKPPLQEENAEEAEDVVIIKDLSKNPNPGFQPFDTLPLIPEVNESFPNNISQQEATDKHLFTYLTYIMETIPDFSYLRTYAESEHWIHGPESESDSSSSDGYYPELEESSESIL